MEEDIIMKHTVKVEKTDQIYKSGNSILNSAKYSSDNTDEWYTTYETIELDGSSRVFQAIEAAGGFLPEAAASAVNQAQPVSDGQQIYVPTQEEAEEGALPAAIQPADPGSETTDANGVVNINTADAAALKSLSGIGDAKAQAILTYREEHGFFSSIEEIMQVPGIKESTFSAIKDKIAVK